MADGSITMAPRSKLMRYPIETLPEEGDDTGITVNPWYVGLHLGDGDQGWPRVGTVDDEIRVKMQGIIDRVNLSKPANKAPMHLRPQLNNGSTAGPIVGTQEAIQDRVARLRIEGRARKAAKGEHYGRAITVAGQESIIAQLAVGYLVQVATPSA